MTTLRSPTVLAAADWSTNGKKRSWCLARLDAQGRYVLDAPEPVGTTYDFVSRLRAEAGPRGGGLIGFDFPIGLPAAWAAQAGLSSFRQGLEVFGRGLWSDFHTPTLTPSLRQPFCPSLPMKKGQARKAGLVKALGLESTSDLLRTCEKTGTTRPEALFWVVGARQVGRASICGWRQVLAPAWLGGRLNVWPFDGPLNRLLAGPGMTVVEIYPALAVGRLGLDIGRRGRSKRRREDRKAQARTLLALQSERLAFSAGAAAAIETGFQTEDDFDALIATVHLVLLLDDDLEIYEPRSQVCRTVEGWILGLPSRERLTADQ